VHHDPFDDVLGNSRDLGQQPVTTGLEPAFEVGSVEMQHRADGLEVEHFFRGEIGECRHGLLQMPLGPRVEVVLDNQTAVVLDPTHEFFHLEQDEATVGAELDDVALDFLGDAPHHLGPLQNGHDIAHRYEIFDLQRR
jgi:hypothetical protein